MTDQIQDQPPPKPNETVPVWELVIQDMRDRDRIGRERYGTPLQINNGRNALVDAYQEILDLAVYVRQEIEQRRHLARNIEQTITAFLDPNSLFLHIGHGDSDHQEWLKKELGLWFAARLANVASRVRLEVG